MVGQAPHVECLEPRSTSTAVKSPNTIVHYTFVTLRYGVSKMPCSVSKYPEGKTYASASSFSPCPCPRAPRPRSAEHTTFSVGVPPALAALVRGAAARPLATPPLPSSTTSAMVSQGDHTRHRAEGVRWAGEYSGAQALVAPVRSAHGAGVCEPAEPGREGASVTVLG